MRLGDWIWHILRSKGDCGEKLSLSIFIFVALQVFYLLLIDLVPPTSLTMSLLGTYLLFTLVLVNASIFITIITLNIHWRHPNTHHMPNWVKRWFFQIIPPFIFMSKPHIANAILESNDEEPAQEEMNKDQSITRLNSYLQSIPIDRYPPVIQQAVRDIRYISETQREAKDDLVRSWTTNCSPVRLRFRFRSRNGKVGGSSRWSSIAVFSFSSSFSQSLVRSWFYFRHQRFTWKPMRLNANTHAITVHNWVKQRNCRSNGFFYFSRSLCPSFDRWCAISSLCFIRVDISCFLSHFVLRKEFSMTSHEQVQHSIFDVRMSVRETRSKSPDAVSFSSFSTCTRRQCLHKECSSSTRQKWLVAIKWTIFCDSGLFRSRSLNSVCFVTGSNLCAPPSMKLHICFFDHFLLGDWSIGPRGQLHNPRRYCFHFASRLMHHFRSVSGQESISQDCENQIGFSWSQVISS